MSGKSLSIIAGIMTILATWVFCWFYVGSTYWYGFGGLANFINIVIIPYNSYMVDDFAKIYSSPTMVYIVAFLALLFLISGPLQLIGAKKKSLSYNWFYCTINYINNYTTYNYEYFSIT